MFIFLILTSSIFTAVGSYLDKYLVNLGISRDDYFYYMSFSLVPFALIMMGIEYFSHALKFSLNIIPIVLLVVAMILRYYKQHTIVGYLKYLTPYEASAYLTLGLVLAFFIDVVIGTEEFTVFSVISVFITVFGVFLLADTKLKLKDLRKVPEEPKKKEKKKWEVKLNMKSVDSRIDLRGMDSEEACYRTDKYLDEAYLGNLGEVTIVHGKGTGILRKAINDMLKRHPHVKSYRLGVYGEGGDGVTIVELK